jgi:lipoprotein-releasing system permease protein
MWFAWMVAVRFLREGRVQSLLIFLGVAVGTAVIIFLSALIDGLEVNIIHQTLGSQAHLVVRMPDEVARPVLLPTAGDVVMETQQRPPQRLRSVENWPAVRDVIAGMDGVVAVSAVVTGAAVVTRGQANRAVLLRGIVPEDFERIIPMRSRLRAGTFGLVGMETMLGMELAKELGVDVGDRVRLSSVEGRTDVYTVRAIFDLGNKDVNERWVLVPLRSAQTLLDLAGGVSSLDVKLSDIFQANTRGDAIMARTGLQADTWMRTNTQLLAALRSQSSSSTTIQFFVVLAVALGIASVLVVSVVQKSREIGILRAMGLSTPRVMGIFLVQGALVGLVGSLLGSGLGALLASAFIALVRAADGTPLFPIDVNATLLLRTTLLATLTGILSAVAPARRAARLDPAVVISHG